MSYESYFSKRRLRNAAIGAIVGAVIVLIIFLGFQTLGFFISGGETLFRYSLWAAVGMGIVVFFSMILLTPRTYLGPEPKVAVDEKVDSRVETTVEAMEKTGEGHFHVKGERKEEDVLKRLEESHEPQDTRKES